MSPAFAAKWLLPRIDRFQSLCPGTDVRLDTNLKPVDFVAQGVDIGVRYGTGRWPGLTAEKRMDEEVYPVCSPQLLRKHRHLQTPEDLGKEMLIHDLSMDSHTGFPTWEAWMQKAGVAMTSIPRGMQINNSAAVLQAAVEGHGVALARSVMAHDDLASGRLVRLFPEYRAECANQPKLATFRDWLLAEARRA